MTTMPIPVNFLQTILVTGDDRIAFLQGQLSCNMNNAVGSIQLATMCNPKGRIIVIFHVICASEAVYLVARADLVEAAATHLRRFVFRSKVQINDQHSISVFLSDIAAEPQNTELEPGAIEEVDKDTVRARLANPNTLELTLSSNSFASENIDDAESFWCYQMHASAIPELTLEQSEKYLPEPLNLDLSGGISFIKGCYTGQEVIARMHYLGKAKKRLFQFTTNESVTISPGSPVFDRQDNNIGEVFSVTCATRISDARRNKEVASSKTDATDNTEPTLLGLCILTAQIMEGLDSAEPNQYYIKQNPDAAESIYIMLNFLKY